MRHLYLLTVMLLPSLTFAHGGGLDTNGGHHDRKNGGYHCHRSPCYEVHKQTERATEEAVREQRPFSLVYRREDWKHWSDLDGDCMNTRHEMLKAQADGPIKLSPDGCYVSTGLWNDPFSGKAYTRASDLDVDHVIPLKWAHEHGGANWTADRKEEFANDPNNLLVVDDGLNQEKGAKGPSEWMPPNHSYRCDYLGMWKKILSKYELAMRADEKRIFYKQLEACRLN